MARSRSSNHGAELTYGDEKIVIFCDCLVRAFCENPIFMWKIRFFRVISLIFCVKRLSSLSLHTLYLLLCPASFQVVKNNLNLFGRYA